MINQKRKEEKYFGFPNYCTSMYRLALAIASDRPELTEIARASVRATRKKSASPIASLADAIFTACSSAGITYDKKNKPVLNAP